MAALGIAKVHDETCEHVIACLLLLVVEVGLEVYFLWKANGVIELDLAKRLQVKYQTLQMKE
jgi:hypothetical protein